MWVTALLLLPLGLSQALFGKRKAGLALIRGSEGSNIDYYAGLDSSLTRTIVQRLRNQDVFDVIQQTIESQTTLPTCSKLAYSSLVHSCSDSHLVSDDNRPDLDKTLDLVKTVFAARLATCDLVEVGVDTVPIDCRYLLEQSVNVQQQSNDQHLRSCLRGLHSDTKAWVSFVNAKQNAIAICHATRAHIEKDTVIDQYRAFADVARNVSDQSWKSTSEMLRVQSDIIKAAQDLFMQLRDSQRAQADHSDVLSEDLQRMHMLSERLGAVLEAYTQSTTNMAQQAAQQTSELVQQQNVLTDSLSASSLATMDNMRTSKEIVDAVLGLVQQLRDDQLDLHNSLITTRSTSQDIEWFLSQHIRQINNVSTSVNELHDRLQASGARIDSLLARLESAFTVGTKLLQRLKLDAIWRFMQWTIWLLLAWTTLSLARWTATCVVSMATILRQATLESRPLLLKWSV